jgi:chromosome segregation ATPase
VEPGEDGYRYSSNDLRKLANTNDSSNTYRIGQAEKDICELEKFSDELRLDRTTLEVKLAQINLTLERHEKDITEVKASANTLATQLTARIDELRTTINDRISKVETTINDRIGKVESTIVDRIGARANVNSKQFIGIMVGIVTAVVLILLTKWV